MDIDNTEEETAERGDKLVELVELLFVGVRVKVRLPGNVRRLIVGDCACAKEKSDTTDTTRRINPSG